MEYHFQNPALYCRNPSPELIKYYEDAIGVLIKKTYREFHIFVWGTKLNNETTADVITHEIIHWVVHKICNKKTSLLLDTMGIFDIIRLLNGEHAEKTLNHLENIRELEDSLRKEGVVPPPFLPILPTK